LGGGGKGKILDRGGKNPRKKVKQAQKTILAEGKKGFQSFAPYQVSGSGEESLKVRSDRIGLGGYETGDCKQKRIIEGLYLSTPTTGS